MPSNDKPSTVGSKTFEPEAFLTNWSKESAPHGANLQDCIQEAFDLQDGDGYVYHAIASVTLQQVQKAIDAGSQNGMHAWYRDAEGKAIEPPSQADIESYTQIFSPQSSTVNAINSLASNAKKESLRALIGQHIKSQLCLPDQTIGLVLPAKQKNPKTAFVNPYYDLWAWSCGNLEWAGPDSDTVKIRQSHHILPIFYHHFGCICPTWDAMSLIQQLVKRKTGLHPIVEIGSGNGYWAFLLRRIGLTVIAVDNALSEWRTTWIGDTIIQDGIKFLEKPPRLDGVNLGDAGCSRSILLLVYPQVSHDITAKFIKAFRGYAIVVAGTQNLNGYTGFKEETIAQWMERERPQFKKVVQIPLPSFAAKDEALFVFVSQEAFDALH